MNSKLLAPVVGFAELIQTKLWDFWGEEHSPYNFFRAQTCQEGIEYAKADNQLRPEICGKYFLSLPQKNL